MYDDDAWIAYPHHRGWFNKLEVSLRLGYACGPCGVAPTVSGYYVVRPIYNLEGMGIGAFKAWIDAGDASRVPPGSFWCEWFDGDHHSVTYRWNDGWHPVSTWQGFNAPDDLSRFHRWVRSKWSAPLPQMFDVLADCGVINVEFVGGRIIEVHLRPSPDPEVDGTLIPVWADNPVEGLVPAFDDGNGFLPVPRIGFVVDKFGVYDPFVPPEFDQFMARVASHLDELVSMVEDRCDMEAVIETLPMIDAARKRLDRMQADPPKYRDKNDGYSAL